MRNNILSYLLLAVFVVGMASCGSDFLDINQNPNNPTSASIELLLPAAQVGHAFTTSRDIQRNASIYARQYYNLGPSTYNVQGSSFNNDWNALYRDPLNDFNAIINQSIDAGSFTPRAIARIHTAAIYGTLVDLWNDVPFSEALQGASNLNPAFDSGADVYVGVLNLLDSALADIDSAIANNEASVASDQVFGTASAANQRVAWRRVANSLKLKFLINLTDVPAGEVGGIDALTEINALIADDDLIAGYQNDFEFQFGTSLSPLNQHPIYQQEYIAGSKNAYMDNYFMYHIISKNDPRRFYYLFRQGEDADIDFQTQPCQARTDCIYGWLGNDTPSNGLPPLGSAADGYIGRDHGDPSGIPGDNDIRATFGVYPIGGKFDDDSRIEAFFDGPGDANSGGSGAGLSIYMTSFNNFFMRAEAQLTLGTTDPMTVEELLEEGIRESMNKVSDFAVVVDPNAEAMDGAAIDAYVAARLSEYAAATTDTERLDVVVKEAYYANFGNGLETYNLIRRTDLPSDLPPALAPTGPFPNRLPYTPDETTANANAPSPLPTVDQQVFWDRN